MQKLIICALAAIFVSAVKITEAEPQDEELTTMEKEQKYLTKDFWKASASAGQNDEADSQPWEWLFDITLKILETNVGTGFAAVINR